jgi:hypothetical protein
MASAEPCVDRACQVGITTAREIVGFKSVMTHNSFAEVVSVESGQGLCFGGRWVGDGGTGQSAQLSNERSACPCRLRFLA